jgi:hypothetical protein
MGRTPKKKIENQGRNKEIQREKLGKASHN